MDNDAKLKKIFLELFEIKDTPITAWRYNELPMWDSVGHMSMISAVESAFDIMLDTDDIIAWNSYEKGKEILTKYGINI